MNPDFDGCGHIPTAADSFTAHYLDMIAFGGWHTGRVARQVVERQRKGEDKAEDRKLHLMFFVKPWTVN
jgi:hypothetical protein